MADGHSHRASGERSPEVPVGGWAQIVLFGFLAVCALTAAVGVWQLWPHEQPDSATYAAPGVTFPTAEVVTVQNPCPEVTGGVPGDPSAADVAPMDAAAQDSCGHLVAKVTSGPSRDEEVTVVVAPAVAQSGLAPGDTVELMRTPGGEGLPPGFSFSGVDRSFPLWVLTAVFVLVVGLVARLRGLLALVGLGFGAVIVVKFMLPALLIGESGLGVALAGSTAIMFVVLYLTHGLSWRTSTALAGTLVGIAIIATIGVVAVRSARLSGATDESVGFLTMFAGEINFQGLLTAALIVAGLGVLNDVTITQSSAVWELRAAAPGLSRRQLFNSGMRIGRDHIASTIYTIVFAYAGAALSVLLLLFLYDRPFLDLLVTDEIAEEITRTLASAIGLVLAVPVTTAIAVAVVRRDVAVPGGQAESP